jgi:glycine cleavage system H protein
MDGFTYTNIFETKGIEYLVIIAFLLLLIPFWVSLNRQVKIKEQMRKAMGVLSLGILKVEQGIFYSRNHTWAYLEKSGNAKVGLDDLLLHITGEVKVRHLKNPGESICKGELLAEVDQNGKSLQIFSPISGMVIDSNPALDENYTLLNEDPYGKGWIYSLKPTNWIAEIPSLYLADEATNWIKKELERYKDFLALNMGKHMPGNSIDILQDGGELADNSLAELPKEMWHDFQKEFLNPQREHLNN